MSGPTRASDVVEQNTTHAAISGGIAVVCLILGVVFFSYGAVPLAIVLFVISAGCGVFAGIRLFQNSQVPIERVACPYCQHVNALTGAPQGDFTCQKCLRRVPVENGVVMPVYKVPCEHCQTPNFFSRRTIKLICEECGKEVNLDSIRSMIQ